MQTEGFSLDAQHKKILGYAQYQDIQVVEEDSGKLMIAVLSAVAEIERENILIQSMAGRRQKARKGRWNGGQTPYRYTIDKDKGILVVNPDEAVIVKLIYDRFLFDHMGYNKVAKWLNDNGYTRKTRKNLKYEAFTGTFVKSVLDDPVYAGKIAYGRRAHEKIQGAQNEYRIVKQDEYETYDGQHEAIIDPEKWNAVHERRLETGEKREKTDEETLKARREALTKSREQYAAAKDKLAERLDTLDYTDPAYDMKYADMEKRLDGLHADIVRVDEDISNVERSLADARSAQATIETAYEWLEFCAGNLDTLDDAAKREIVEGFIERLDIFPERQPDGHWVKSIDFCFPVVLNGTELTHWSREGSNVDTRV